MPSFYSWKDKKLILRVLLKPGSNKNTIVGAHGDYLQIKVSAPAIADKANKALIIFLAKQFGVSISKVILVKGKRSRYKLLHIDTPIKLPEFIMPI